MKYTPPSIYLCFSSAVALIYISQIYEEITCTVLLFPYAQVRLLRIVYFKVYACSDQEPPSPFFHFVLFHSITFVCFALCTIKGNLASFFWSPGSRPSCCDALHVPSLVQSLLPRDCTFPFPGVIHLNSVSLPLFTSVGGLMTLSIRKFTKRFQPGTPLAMV